MNCCSDSSQTPTNACTNKAVATFKPAVDVIEDADTFRIVADVPGAGANDVELEFEKNVLTMTARVASRVPQGAIPVAREYQIGDYRRTFRFDDSIEAAAAGAEIRQGVLTITLPKSASARRHKVQIVNS